MALVRFAMNAEADIASSDEVRAAVDEGTSSILRRLPSRDRGNRRRIPASANVSPAATGTVVLNFGAPAAGLVWWLCEVIVTAADDRTVPPSAVASLYCGAPTRQLTGTTVIDTPPLGALVRPAVAVPAVFAFQTEQWLVHSLEELFVVYYSTVTAISVASAVATVMELPSSAVQLNRT